MFNDALVNDYLLNPDRFVYPFVIKEKNGKERTIITYNKSGKNGALLRRAHEEITKDFSINFAERNTHSFAYHKNVRCYDALQSHLKSNIFIKLDIHHFFESITEELFFSIYGDYFNKDWRDKIKLLFYKGSLSIGFVSSPVISDFFMKKFDKDVETYLLNHPELHYSRYSDDILLSSELDDDTSLNSLFEFVKQELALFKLEINDKKTRRITLDYSKHNSISYLGLNISKSDDINNKITISKRYILFLLFLIEKQRGYTDHCYPLENEIKSRVAYLAYNSPISYQRFQKKHVNKYGVPYMFTPKELDNRSVSNVVNEIPDFDKFSKLFKINIHKKVANNEGFSVNDAIEIEEYIGSDNEVIEIPYFVDSIGDNAFKNSGRKITKIVLNEKLKSIGKNAFSGLTNLQEINLPNSLRYIGDGAFSRCSSLEKIVIPEKIKTIRTSLFEYCYGLKEVVFAEGLETISDCAFLHTAIDKITLPNSLKEIKSGAFSGCEKLKDINLANSNIELIDSCAFSGCVLLEEVVLPNTLLTLGKEAFSSCSSLKRANIPASVLEIGVLPFAGCPLLQSIDVDKDNKIYLHRDDNSSIVDHNGYLLFTLKDTIDNDIKHIGYCVFANSFVKKIVVPEGVVRIDTEAFKNCLLLKNVSLPNSLEGLGIGVFSSCVSLEEITLPEKVRVISSRLFSDCINLKNVKMSEDVYSIEDNAFFGCTQLNINLPKNLQVIGKYAFANCLGSKDLYIPAKVKQIKRDAFKGLNKVLESIRVDEYNTTFASDDTNTIYNVKKGILLFGCKNSKIAQGIRAINKYAFAYCAELKHIDIPNTVQKIGNSAFIGCKGLTRIDLNAVNKIEASAFSKCINLEEVVLPNSLTVIGDKAFANTGLKKLTLPESIVSFGKETFSNCSSLEEINLPSTFTEADLANNVFGGCNYLKHISVNPNSQSFDTSVSCDALISKIGELLLASSSTKIPCTVKKIATKAFAGNALLENIEIPSSVEFIAASSFEKCTSLRSVKFLNKLSFIPARIFYGCTNLEEVELPSSITAISGCAFSNCTNLKTIKLPESLQKIESNAFSDSGIENIVLPSNLDSIGMAAFSGCKSLQNIVLPDSLNELNAYAFRSTSIKSINIPEKINTINVGCFYECDKLEKIDLSGIKNIRDSAFYNCNNLKEVILNDEAELNGHNIFDGCTSLVSIHLPNNLKVIPIGSFQNCTSLKKINFPDTLEIINSHAFNNCPLLEVPNFPDSLTDIGEYAFKDNKNIHNIHLPKLIKAISNGSFFGCDIESITIDKDNDFYSDMESNIITYLDENDESHLLLGCKNSIIPDGINIIDRCAFVNAGKLKNFRLPDSLIRIDSHAFYGVDLGVNEIVFPASLKEVQETVFGEFNNVPNIKFNDGLEKVKFNNFKGVKTIYIPASLLSFAGNFDDDVIFNVNDDNPLFSSIDGKILRMDKRIIYTHEDARLPLPRECVSIASSCYNNRTFDEVNIPEGVVSLSGFNNCQINELHLPKSLKIISSFAEGSVIKKIVVAKGNPYLCTDEKGLNLLDITRRDLYYCNDGNVPEGVTSIGNSAINHIGIDRLVVPSTYQGNFGFNPHLYKEVIVDKDHPYYFSKDNAVINKYNATLVYINNPAIIPEGVKKISSNVINHIGEPYSLLSIPKSVQYIERSRLSGVVVADSITVDKDNPVFDSRDNCNAVIVTAKNLMIIDSTHTVVPQNVIVSSAIKNRNKSNNEINFSFVRKSFNNNDSLLSKYDLPF